jgi:UDP-2,3-diacylglucosamine pyrophosphatase LpxH
LPEKVALLLPAWHRVTGAFGRDESLIIHGPRFYAKSALLRAIGTEYAPVRQASCVFIELAAFRAATGKLEYRRLFDEIKEQLRLRTAINCDDYLSFEEAMKRLTAMLHSRLILLVRLPSRSADVNEECVFLRALHDCLAREFLKAEIKLLALAVDDFSLWNHEQYARVTSEMFRFKRLYLYPLTPEETSSLVRAISASHHAMLSEANCDSWQRHISAATGGHIGLTLEALEFVSELDWQLPAHAEDVLFERLSQSAILSALQLAIQEEPGGLAATALEFREARYPTQLRSSRLLLLRRLGILQSQKMERLILCPGVIRGMVEAIQATGSENAGRLGKVVRETGPPVFEEGNVPLTDDDLVVVHLSDLHVGSEYGFSYLDHHDRAFNQDLPSFVDILCNDLTALEIRDRIDAIVVSGDFVWRGTDAEFRVARHLLEELLRTLGLAEKLVICPGNHDITWLPSQGEAGADAETAKRDAFDAFAEDLGYSFKDGGACCRTVTSRNGKRLLHFLCLDSNFVENERAAGIGFVSQDAFRSAQAMLQAEQQGQGKGLQSHIWMVLHHHIFPATPIRLQDAQAAHLTIMANASEVLAWARRLGVEAILHGHEHQPAVTIARSWPTDSMGKQFVPVVAIGAGSAAVKRQHLGPFGRNQYFVLYRRGGDTIVRSRCLGDEGLAFTAHNDFVL